MKYSFYLLLLIMLSSVVFASQVNDFNTSDPQNFEYVTSVDVLCTEYRGYVRFELPDTMNESQYYETDKPLSISVDKSFNSFRNSPDWFVTSIDGYNIRDVEAIYDKNSYSNLIVENNQITLPFQNPDVESVSQITIQMADSTLEDIQFSVDGQTLSYTQSQSDFYYQFDLTTPVLTDSIDITLSYEDVAKIAEVRLNTEVDIESQYGYFYVDNTCNETVTIYHGSYKSDESFLTGSKSLPVIFPTVVRSTLNPVYNDDFDGDGVSNSVDNCPYVSNPDQKDIDYNNKGDACQDADSDGIYDLVDNCPSVANANQLDTDKDDIGDACDEEDNRFFEENAPFVYLLGFIIAVVFILFSIKIVKSNEK